MANLLICLNSLSGEPLGFFYLIIYLQQFFSSAILLIFCRIILALISSTILKNGCLLLFLTLKGFASGASHLNSFFFRGF